MINAIRLSDIDKKFKRYHGWSGADGIYTYNYNRGLEVVLYHRIDAMCTARHAIIIMSATIQILYTYLTIGKGRIKSIGYNILSIAVGRCR